MKALQLQRPPRPGLRLTLTPLVDVLLILLIFFMVTSTYLDLDMIPMADPGEAPVEAPVSTTNGATMGSILIRLSGDGQAYLGGRALSPGDLSVEITRRIGDRITTPILILPSARAGTQALVDVLGAVAASGATNAQVVRFDEGGQ